MEQGWQWRAFSELAPDDLYDLLQLRALVFVVEQRCAYNDLDGHDQHAEHLFRRDAAGRMQACLRLLPPGVKYVEPSIGRVVTHPDARRTGIGLALMREGLRRAADRYPGHGVRIGAQRRLERFYESLGFVTVSAPYDEDGIEHVEMLRPPGP